MRLQLLKRFVLRFRPFANLFIKWGRKKVNSNVWPMLPKKGKLGWLCKNISIFKQYIFFSKFATFLQILTLKKLQFLIENTLKFAKITFCHFYHSHSIKYRNIWCIFVYLNVVPKYDLWKDSLSLISERWCLTKKVTRSHNGFGLCNHKNDRIFGPDFELTTHAS